jgi:hypothetical protein
VKKVALTTEEHMQLCIWYRQECTVGQNHKPAEMHQVVVINHIRRLKKIELKKKRKKALPYGLAW